MTQAIDVGCMMNVVHWATEQATAHVSLAHPHPDLQWIGAVPMSLWKDFQIAFPKDTTPGDYEAYVMLYGSVYSEVVRALIKRSLT